MKSRKCVSTKNRDARAEPVVLIIKPIGFFKSSLWSSSYSCLNSLINKSTSSPGRFSLALEVEMNR